ncbi:hypothetical protein Aros01_04474 [Streptosporangium roseum]
MLFAASPYPAGGGWVPLTAHLPLFADMHQTYTLSGSGHSA